VLCVMDCHSFLLELSAVCPRPPLVNSAACMSLCSVTVCMKSVVLFALVYDWHGGFESCRGHGCPSVVFVVRCVRTGLCDELIACSE
jgi:hypothetical protein